MNLPVAQSYSDAASSKVLSTGGIEFAYRRVGEHGGTPLILANYFAANLDDWDPLIVDGLASGRDVIVFDYTGVGSTTGRTPATVSEIAADVVQFVQALELTSIDVLGFSLGGMVAQEIASTHPDLVRRLILCGTGPRGGVNMTFTELSAEELGDPVALLLNAFFTPSDASQAAGRAYLERLRRRTSDHDAPVAAAAADAQLRAIRTWGMIPAEDRYAMLATIRQPTLIIHGNSDVVVDPVNAVTLAQRLIDGTLLMLPDSSHGAQSQHADSFLTNVDLFLAR